MTDFSVRSDNVDVEQIMRQIRSRIREKRGVDYTEDEIRELANVKLEKFLDPRGVRSDLLEQFRRKREASLPPNFAFEDTTLYETHRGFLRFMRRLLRPILKLFFNPNPLIEALHIQSKLNAQQAALEPLYYEVIHNLVLETTRLGIEVKNLKMRVESMSSRLDFDERRARALEGVVQYRPGAVPPLQPPGASGPGGAERPLTEAEQAERRSRRRRRRGRRRPGDQGPPTRDGESARSGQVPREQGLRGPRSAGGRDEGSAGGDVARDQGPGRADRAAGESPTRGIDRAAGESPTRGIDRAAGESPTRGIDRVADASTRRDRGEETRGDEGAAGAGEAWRDPGEGGNSGS
jgi:hypothetical protein